MKDNELNKEDCTIGLSLDQEVLIMTMPLKKFVDNEMDGAALLFGKFRELQAHATQLFSQQRQSKFKGGILRPGGNGKHPPTFDSI
jgi:hypothetical protein